ncbi:hypothetical protein Nepgr_031434 [Nepenthes gracilis]|uniref:Growth-regulating factor n=1 Tax=Nepenthes gracilis TaxID=150966 RepID=A0AAD3TI44_NEPGR|nr:hypothetical protein Nepgr_031434 [Nepenthes gracilis]
MRGEISSGGGVVGVELGLKLQDDGPPLLCSRRYRHDCDEGSGFNEVDIRYLSDMCGGSAASDSTTTVPPPVVCSAAADGGAAAVRSSLQPFDISYLPAYSPFKSSGGMAATMGIGFPFTAAQWKELQRQAMIYKFMMACVPIPRDLLFPMSTNLSDPSSSTYSLGKVDVLNLTRGGNSRDAEPGRCKRTDGKKWRCSRDVAPNQKYCERHLNRGRPRSRKPVEIRADFSFNPGKISDAKKSRLIDSQNSAINGSTSASQCLGVGSSVQRFIRNHEKAPFEPMVSTATTYGAPRFSDWVIKGKGGSEQQWQQLELEDIGLETEASFCKANLSVFQHHLEDQPPKVSSSSLASSMADSNHLIDDEICRIHMGLGVIDSDFNNEDDMKNQVSIASWLSPASWVPSNPGGPLAEVLGHHPTTVPDSDPSSAAGNGYLVTPPATVTSSPSGVLQNTIASLSDSSGSNSPIFLRI